MNYQKLIDEFLKNYTSNYNPKIRGNCGFVTSDLMLWMENKFKIQTKRIFGWFYCDDFVSSKKDFTPEMRNKLIEDGYEWNSKKSRREWLILNDFSEEYRFIPHYWLEDMKGSIIDPTGYFQFIETNLSSDLKENRYLSQTDYEYKNNLNFRL
jgi:hypothetical protein